MFGFHNRSNESGKITINNVECNSTQLKALDLIMGDFEFKKQNKIKILYFVAN